MPTPSYVNRYDIGDLATLSATVIGTDGLTPVQPSWFAFLVKNPVGSIATYFAGTVGASVLNPTNGVFTKDVSVDYAGTWFYRAIATGKAQASEEWTFIGDKSFIL